VALRVNPESATPIPNNPAYGFLGKPGDTVFLLPEHEKEELLFVGIASDEIESGVFEDDQVRLALRSIDGPGEFFLYSTDQFGKPLVFMDTSDGISGEDQFVIKAGEHSHQAIAFSQAGIYRAEFVLMAKLESTGEEIRSEPFKLLFEVLGEETTGIKIDGHSNSSEHFTLSFESKPGLAYVIESSHDLKSWSKLGEVTGTGGLAKFTDFREALLPMQFYRVKLME